MSKIKLTGSNSGYVEISSAADAGNLTLALPTSGTVLLSNTDNVFTGITTFAGLNITSDVTFNGASYNVLWDASDNQFEFGDNAKLSFGGSSDLQIYHGSNVSHIAENGTGPLRLSTDEFQVMNSAQNKTMIYAAQNLAVSLNYNGNTKIQTTNTGAIVTGICTATSFSGSGENLTRTTQLSHRNVIINGDMRIAQRATSHNSSGYRTIDRFKMTAGGASHTLTQAQVDVASGTSPYVRGFRKAFSITNAGQNANNQGYVYMLYEIEAQDIATSGWRYMYNTSGDDYITVSFWVKASVAQTYLFFIHTADGTTKEWNHLMSLSANAWTKVTIPIPGNSGITINNDTGVGLRLYWCAYLGDHYTSTGSVDQWVTHAGYTSRPDMGAGWWTTSNATFQLTGVQLEVGEQATPFEHRSYKDELRRCYRYFQRRTDGSNYQWVSLVSYYANSEIHGFFDHYETMRASPTLSTDTGANTLAVQRAGGYAVFTTGLVKNGGNNNVTYYYRDGVTLGTSGQAGRCLTWSSGCNITLDAEF